MVYVISDNAGHVKIGVAVNVETRLKHLQTANANELEMVLTFKCGDKEKDRVVEQHLHNRFADHNIRNRNNESSEWFDDCILPELFKLSEGISDDIDYLARQIQIGLIYAEKQPPTLFTIGEYERLIDSMSIRNGKLAEKINEMKLKEKDLRAQIKEKNEIISGLKRRLKR